MTPQALRAAESLPSGLSRLVQALWHEARGDWQRAHEITQELEGPEAAWVHAYLHRVEGDEFNAGYWYRRAGRAAASGPLEQEWEQIVAALT